MRIGQASFRSIQPEQVVPAPQVRSEAVSPPSAPAGGPSAFAQLLHGLSRRIDDGERTVRGVVAAGQRDLGPAELLALQAGVYRYSEAVDLAAKLVDRGTSGVKTVLSGS